MKSSSIFFYAMTQAMKLGEWVLWGMTVYHSKMWLTLIDMTWANDEVIKD